MKNLIPIAAAAAALFALSRANASNSGLRTTSRGVNLIKEFEGFRPTPYKDGEFLAIGYGTTQKSDVPASLFNGTPITEAQATALLKQHLANSVEPAIATLVQVPITSNEHDALASFIYNIGQGNFANSTLLRELNNGNRGKAADAFLLWNKASGKVVEGLNRRRAAERGLFLGNNGVYS